MTAARSPFKAALSLYVVVAAHLLLLFGLALSGGLQLPGGDGQGLGGAGESAGDVSAATEQTSTTTQRRPPVPTFEGQLALAPSPVMLGPSQQQAQPEPITDSTDVVADAIQAESSQAAIAGSTGGGRGGYLADLRRHLSRHRHSLPGVFGSAHAEVAFTVDAQGRVTDLRLQRGSGIAALDAEATALIRRAEPLPAPPGGISRRFVVPVSVDPADD